MYKSAKHLANTTASEKYIRQNRINNPQLRCAGFSLVTVAALGAAIMLWLFATTETVMPMYKRAAQNRYLTVVRSAAEAGLDYVIGNLNIAQAASVTSSLDDGSYGAPYTTTVLPANLVGTNGASVSVTVRNEKPPSTSYVYDQLTDSFDPNNAVNGINYFRIVTAQASYAGLTKTIRVILKPIHTPPSYSTTTTTTTSTSTVAVPYFKYAMFARGLLSMSGNAYTDAYNSDVGPYGGTNIDTTSGNVGTNYQGTLSGNANVGGNLYVFSTPLGSTTATVATATDNAVIQNELITNGIENGFSTDNVLAQGPPLPKPPGYDPIYTSQSNPQVTFPPAPSAPDGAYNVGAVSVSSNASIVVKDGASLPGSLSVSGNNTIYIPPGDYIVSSLSVTGNGMITIQSSVSSPVRFFIQGSSSGSNVVSITGNGIANQTSVPGMLQLWYDGTKSINLAGNGNLYGVVYAPNSNISISGNGSYYGALVGNKITNSGNGAVHYDTALLDTQDSSSISYQSTSTSSSTTTTTQASVQVTGFQTVSWQEL